MQRANDFGQEALAFLTRQRLAPTPQNYTVAYLVLTKPDSPIASAVNAITDGGVRIKQVEADNIFDLHGGVPAPSQSSSSDNTERDIIRHQTLKLGDVVASAAAASGSFTRDLSADAKALDADAADRGRIISRMIERSQRAELDLNAAAREVEELRQELEVVRGDAERDQLTGLPNRRAIERRLQALAEADRARVVGICDVDHFKSINDRYGHTVGDRVLKQVASVLAAACAPHFIGRWGGEEFLLIIDADDVGHGVAVLEEARSDLAARHFKLRETDEPIGMVSFSAGVSVARGDHLTSTAAIERADALLYQAKAAGRNRVLQG